MNNAILKDYNLQVNWGLPYIEEKCKKNKIEIIKTENNKIWIEIKSYRQSYAMCPVSWCIQNSLNDYNSHILRNEEQRQYICYDFNKNKRDKLSIVGITIDSNKDILHIFNFHNVSVCDNVEDLISLDIPSYIANTPSYMVED